MEKKINIDGKEIVLFSNKDNYYISLTDIAKFKNEKLPGLVISHWISTKYTIEFMGFWEEINNPSFKLTEFSEIKNQSGSHGFVLSSKQWIEKTNSIGIISKTGRYGGGTYAHKDIAFEFASWISPKFKLFLIQEFQRLREEENERKSIDWDLNRSLAKINYEIHTNSIKENLIPKKITKEQKNQIYASEADILNIAIFGMTAKKWRIENKKKEGNIRDYANISQLVCLSNLESINALMIKEKINQKTRLIKLNEIAISQMKVLIKNNKLLGNNLKKRLEVKNK
jgi:hypothetical protein